MDKTYFVITGLNYYYGSEFLEKDMVVDLIKEPENEFDKEAIKVDLFPIGTIGHVANSARTVLGDCSSAGRIYDKFDEKAQGKVMYVLPQGVVCELIVKDKE